MMAHAWGGYRRYAWGKDELRPSSNTGMDWLGLGATIVDSLDTLWIMGMKDEFAAARDWVANDLSFDRVRVARAFVCCSLFHWGLFFR